MGSLHLLPLQGEFDMSNCPLILKREIPETGSRVSIKMVRSLM